MLAEGRVQGVGFRVRVSRIARRRGLKGLVRNLRDGRVEMFCEGPRETILIFMDEVLLLGKNRKWVGPRVDRISCFLEGESGYAEAWREYSTFEIDPEWG
ncbi:MAG: acylphosphatase [Candidatus Bathyarchaeota archaeon]|nr:MAG: acylphosphatase [Candidatus Bathyarchaeota archaeon]